MTEQAHTKYVPPWARHIEGEVAPKPEGADPADPVLIRAKCTLCGATWQRQCTSGMHRTWIGKFALAHLHRNRLDPLPTEEKKT